MTARGSKEFFGSDEFDFVFKFIVSSAILSLSMAHRITEHRFAAPFKHVAAGAEIVAVSYMYQSSFQGTRFLLQNHLATNGNLIASLGASFLLMPGAISYLAQKTQQRIVKKRYRQGSQRIDNALYSSGLTSVGNIYFQANHFLMEEVAVFSRLFQLGLISDNILHGKSLLQQFRNFPALFVDFFPNIGKNLSAQQEKIEADYRFNTAKQSILVFTKDGPVVPFPTKSRYLLRNGDLVACDDKFDFECTPISGEVVSIKEKDGRLIPEFDSKKFSINLKSHNGEDKWNERKTHSELKKIPEPISLSAIQDNQIAILPGTKLNIFKQNHFFIRVKEEKERTQLGGYQKHSVMNDIIIEHKKRMVYYACALSLTLAIFVAKSLPSYPVTALRLLLNLFQMLIPFSESFLREMINGRLMKKLNQHLEKYKLETIDALRIADFCNALGAYYKKEYARGVAIISDKTGTLTTSKMNVLGMWTDNAAENKSDVECKGLKRKLLLPSPEIQKSCFEVFAAAFTNNKKEIEPEEHAMRELFASELNMQLEEPVLRDHHFVKTIRVHTDEKDVSQTFKTYHLGLYGSTLGGRLTLMEDANHTKYLIFCGIPNPDAFKNTPLAQSYYRMETRKGVLSRDWCLARAKIENEEFEALRQYLRNDNKKEIENYIRSNPHLLQKLNHYCTFLIDNPVKKCAEKFISNCRKINVPVFIATGDNVKAAENIARVLSSESSQQMTVIRESDAKDFVGKTFSPNSTVIFAGINEDMLRLFSQIISVETHQQPFVIFSQVSTAGKRLWADILKELGFFLVVNGDGSNDIGMMKSADMVLAHLTEDDNYAPGVGQFANLNDRQLQQLLHSDQSFYELFDIEQNRSLFKDLFTPLANSQEKPSMALLLKSVKMSFELAASVGLPVKEMWQQHWFSVGFDLCWLGISFHEINHSVNLPANNQHINNSNFRSYGLAIVTCLAALESFLMYGESTSLTLMVSMLVALSLVLKSLFLNFGEVQMKRAAEQKSMQQHPLEPKPEKSKQKLGFFKSLLPRAFHAKPQNHSTLQDAHKKTM